MAKLFATSLLAGSSLAKLVNYVAKARHIQQPQQKICLIEPFSEGIDFDCDGEDWVHRTICNGENEDFYLEAKCSCYQQYWNILLPRDECIWESKSLPKPAPETTTQIQITQPTTLQQTINKSTTTPTTTSTSSIEQARELEISSLNSESCRLSDLSPDFNWSCESDVFLHGVTCYASCGRGYRLDKPANAKVTCNCLDGDFCKWENSRVAVKTELFNGIGNEEEMMMEGGSSLLKMECSAENEEGCALPENLENGFFHCPNGHFANSRCQIICNDGFSLPSGTRSAVKCTKRLAWNADIENIRCQPVFGSGGERGIVIQTGNFCDAPENSQESFVGEFECESEIYADRSKCLLKCPQGYVSQTKSPKQNWKKCRCKKSGECRWSREQSIGCVKLGSAIQKLETSNRLEGRRKMPSLPVISNLLSCAHLEEQLDKNFRRPKCTHGSEENSFCLLNCKLGRTLDRPKNAWRKCSCSDGKCFWIGDPVQCL